MSPLKELENRIEQAQFKLESAIAYDKDIVLIESKIKDVHFETLKEYADKFGETLSPISQDGYITLQKFKHGKTVITVQSKKQRVIIEEED